MAAKTTETPVPTGKRQRCPTLAELWGQRIVKPRVELSRPHSLDDDADKVLVVDLFSGCGGFSTGAESAGHKVVLAVDCCRAALAYHKANHRGSAHARMVLGPGCDDRLLELIRSYVPEGRRWHLHGSPPCTLFSSMRNLTKGKDHHTGMALVTWYLDFLQKAQPDTWTFENVRSPAIREHLQERGVAHGYFDFVKYGVPQTRKRCLAGSASIIDAFRNNTSLRATPARTPRDVLDPPHDAAYIRASAGKNTEYFNRSLDEPTWALLCTAKPTYTRHNQSCVRVLSMRELLSLQTFPDSYRMKSSGHLGSLASEMDRVRLVGNAVPPLVAEKLMAAVH